tara:strand:- start:14406 stop:14972 length:567 start_codon:yes stop_codon:yes gene_type:complete
MSRVEKYIETKEKYFKTSLERDRTGLLHNHIKNTLNETLKYTKIGKTISVFVILACLSLTIAAFVQAGVVFATIVYAMLSLLGVFKYSEYASKENKALEEASDFFVFHKSNFDKSNVGSQEVFLLDKYNKFKNESFQLKQSYESQEKFLKIEEIESYIEEKNLTKDQMEILENITNRFYEEKKQLKKY